MVKYRSHIKLIFKLGVKLVLSVLIKGVHNICTRPCKPVWHITDNIWIWLITRLLIIPLMFLLRRSDWHPFLVRLHTAYYTVSWIYHWKSATNYFRYVSTNRFTFLLYQDLHACQNWMTCQTATTLRTCINCASAIRHAQKRHYDVILKLEFTNQNNFGNLVEKMEDAWRNMPCVRKQGPDSM